MPDENEKLDDKTAETEVEVTPEADATRAEPEAAAEAGEPEEAPEAAVEAEEPAAAEPAGGEPAEPATAAEPEEAPAPTAAVEAEEPAADEAVEPEPAAEAEAEEPAAAAEPEPEPEAAPAEPQPKKNRKRLPRALRRQRPKPVRERPATRKAIVRTPKPDSEPGRRQERRGVVVSDKGDKTIVVSVDVTKIHPKYKKVVRRSRRFHAHDEQNAAGIGDTVRIVETRPLSKTKRWRLAEVVEKAK
jgi:small subunit ribosomal protein S17